MLARDEGAAIKGDAAALERLLPDAVVGNQRHLTVQDEGEGGLVWVGLVWGWWSSGARACVAQGLSLAPFAARAGVPHTHARTLTRLAPAWPCMVRTQWG